MLVEQVGFSGDWTSRPRYERGYARTRRRLGVLVFTDERETSWEVIRQAADAGYFDGFIAVDFELEAFCYIG